MDNICHDPGYKVTKDCQEYVCRNGLNGFELVKEGNKLLTLTLSNSFDDDIILTKQAVLSSPELIF